MPETTELLAYHTASRPLVCELDANPYCCEFWPLDQLDTYNHEYQVSTYAPGYFGFATSGAGEMFAISPAGAVVCLPFIGMEPAAAIQVAPTWAAFQGMLRGAA